MDEVLGPATPPLQAAYLFEAPDRMQLTLATGETTVWISPTHYTIPRLRYLAGRGPRSSLAVRTFRLGHCRVRRQLAHILGSETVDGVQTKVLTFFLDLPQTPVWFNLWVDADGRVHRASMRAQGHFMDHTFTNFDGPVSIEPPA